MEHSPIGPSTAGYWAPKGACTGFVKMAANYPEEQTLTGRSVEGTVAHNIGERMIEGQGFEDMAALIDTLDPDTGVLITSEMIEACEVYAREVSQRIPLAIEAWQIGIEERLQMRGIHEDMFGTCDAFLVDVGSQRITVWDFKYGMSPVEAFENWQLLAYVYGVASYMAAHDTSATPEWTVDMRIVQPRAFHADGPIRSWSSTLGELQPYFEQLKTAASETQGPKATCRTGTRCKYCPARHACKALQQDAASAAEYAGTPTPQLITGEALSVELTILTDAARAINDRLSGLTEQATQSLKGGDRVPGWEIKRTKGREKWTDTDTALMMAGALGVDITKPAFLTPNQARNAGLSADVVASCSERGEGKAELKPINKQKLNRIFK